MSASFEVKTREPEAHYPEFSSAKFSRNDSGVVVGTGAGGGRWKLATIILGALSAVLLVALIVALANNGNGGDGSSDGDGGDAPAGFSELSPGGGLCSADAEVAIAESPSCSNGTYYFDRGSGGVEVCECFQGFVGKACEVKVPEEKVVVTARSGTSTSNMITARYWAENEMIGDGRSGLVSMVSSYRIGYNWGSEGAGWSLMGDLDTTIRDLHTKVGNAKVSLVFHSYRLRIKSQELGIATASLSKLFVCLFICVRVCVVDADECLRQSRSRCSSSPRMRRSSMHGRHYLRF